MPQDKWSAITLCPYYRSHSEVGIYCEGPVTQSHLTLEFATRAQREHYQAETCACYLYRACPLALAAGRKYEQRERRRFNAAGQKVPMRAGEGA